MDMRKLMQQAQQMQQQVTAAQEALAKETVEASAGGGMVVVQAMGSGEIRSIKIDPESVDLDDIELLEDMVLAAVTSAQQQVNELTEKRMNGVVPGGMGGMLPGM